VDIAAISSLIQKEFPEAILGLRENTTPACLEIKTDTIHALGAWIRTEPKLYMDQLSCLSGLDNGPEAGTMEVVYTLYSIPHDVHLQLACVLSRDKPEISTVSDIWRTADWHEREAYDFFGIQFIGHPDLRRILLPEDWEGHPLRKDYAHQEKYHGITVKY